MGNSISEFWASLPLLEQVLWTIALLFSMLFIVQALFTFFTGDDGGHGDADSAIGDDDGAGQQLFTVKNLIAFFTLFGWTALGCLQSGVPVVWTLVVATLSGSAMVALMMFLFSRITRMKESGTLIIQNAVGLTGRTYLVIPGGRSGLGKVQVRVQGGLKELDAMTELPDAIPSGTMVKVQRILDQRILIVTTNLD